MKNLILCSVALTLVGCSDTMGDVPMGIAGVDGGAGASLDLGLNEVGGVDAYQAPDEDSGGLDTGQDTDAPSQLEAAEPDISIEPDAQVEPDTIALPDVCEPSCAGKECGQDGCGGLCGVCGNGWGCSQDGTCLGPPEPDVVVAPDTDASCGNCVHMGEGATVCEIGVIGGEPVAILKTCVKTPAGCLFWQSMDCNDYNACTTDSCDPAKGECVNEPQDSECDDGSLCTFDQCNPKVGCTHQPVTCAGGNACLIASCDPAQGCVYEGVDCDDGIDCTDDYCDPVKGCQNSVSQDAYSICEDGDPCTKESCVVSSPGAGCQHDPIPNCLAWVDKSDTACSDLLATYSGWWQALPTNNIKVTLTFKQVSSVKNGGNESYFITTLKPTNCVSTWLYSMIMFPGSSNWSSVCTAQQDGTGEIAFFNTTGENGDRLGGVMVGTPGSWKVYTMLRAGEASPCDLTVVDYGTTDPPSEYNQTNASDYGSVGDYVSISWE